MRKGELSINIIILIAIGLLILVILAFGIANGWFNLWQGSACPSEGGVCRPITCQTGEQQVLQTGEKPLCSGSQVCCSAVG